MLNRRQFLSASLAAASYGASRSAWALPASGGIFADVAAATADSQALAADVGYWTRYLTLAALPADYDLPAAYAGLSYWCNSLSSKAFIRPPRQVGKTLFAVDLRDYGWSLDAWNALTKFDGYYGLVGSIILRADFFVHATSITTRFKSYYDFLYGFGKAPKTGQELRDRFRIRLEDSRIIQKERGIPVRFGDSGVASQNRLIISARTLGGDYWETFDSLTSAGQQNLPNNLAAIVDKEGRITRQFKHDAGEIIFSLPNELHGFLLVDGKGNRLEKADGEVVKVPFLFTARRCVECHRSQGILIPKALIPEWVKVGVDLDSMDKASRDWFEAFYSGDPQGIAIRGAQERHQDAVVKCWSTAKGETVAATAETIVAGFLNLCEWYNRPLLLVQACHELGYNSQQVQLALQEHKTTNVSLPALGADFGYPRDDWEANGFRQLRSVLKSGGY